MGLFVYGIGANDVANSQGMAVGSGAITLIKAQIMASIFEFLGAALIGQHVSCTVGEKIVDIDEVSAERYSWGMFAAILSTAIWMFSASLFENAQFLPSFNNWWFNGKFQLIINEGNLSSEHWDVLVNIGISGGYTIFIIPIIHIFDVFNR